MCIRDRNVVEKFQSESKTFDAIDVDTSRCCSCLERTNTSRHVCTVPASSCLAVVSRLIFSAVPFPTLCRSCEVTRCHTRTPIALHLLTYFHPCQTFSSQFFPGFDVFFFTWTIVMRPCSLFCIVLFLRSLVGAQNRYRNGCR